MVSSVKGASAQQAAPSPIEVNVPRGKSAAVSHPSTVDFDQAQANRNIHAAVGMLNQQMAESHRGLGFSYDDSVKSPVIMVRNTATGEVVRQIPSEDVLRVAHKMDALRGILYNKAA